MDEFYNHNQQPIDLHTIAALQEIEVRPGITIRPLSENDTTEILAILDTDPDIRNRVTLASKLHSKEDVTHEITTSEAETGLIRYTVLKGGNPIGMVSLWRDSGFFVGTKPNPDDYGFGYFLHPDERGKGIVTGAVTRLMEAVADNLTVRQFVAFCEDDNEESLAVLNSLGFTKTNEAHPEPTHGWLEYKYVCAPAALA